MLRDLSSYFFILRSGLFDKRYYLHKYMDVRRADIDPVWHYLKFGWKEERNPAPWFDTNFYLRSNPDVRQSNINPLVHFIRYGKKEGRRPNFDSFDALNSDDVRKLPNTVSPTMIGENQLTSRKKPNIFLIKIRNGLDYIRVNGFKKYFIKGLKKIINPQKATIQQVQYISATSENNTYEAFYKDHLAQATGNVKNEYVDLRQYSSTSESTEIKLIAFYLPQFHPISENDLWWGKGFTEWTNVSKAVPQFLGHYQPHLPGELGFYDLRVPEVQRRQVELAKNYGIYGFCFYYYWFKGKRLLEYPLDRFIHDPEIDFPFCICWANENWTRRWDGHENDVLIAQDHSVETDLEFIQDAIELFKHKNYITINGHPLLVVYRVDLLPDPQNTAKLWKEICLSAGLKEPYLIAAQTFGFTDPRKAGFDAAVEFPPHNIAAEGITDQVKILNPNYAGCVYRYAGKSSLIDLYSSQKHNGYEVFKTVSPGWDNEPRKPGKGSSFAYSTPESYKSWLKAACDFTIKKSDPDERIVFINAWNEWGEGAYLEPDRKYGYAYLQATYDTANQYSKLSKGSDRTWTILFVLHDAYYGGAQILIRDIISWLHDHTSVRIKQLFLAPGDLLQQFSHFGDTLVLENTNDISEKEFISKVLEFCGEKPDLIYGNTVAVGKVYSWLKKIGSPIITHIHELEMSIKRYASGWISELIQNSDHFIAVSDSVSKNLQSNHGVNAEVISKIYGGISNVEDGRPLDGQAKQSLKRELGIPDNKKVIVGCGRGMPFRKGADLFIETAKRVQQRLPDTLFLWVGDFEPNESDEQLGSWRDYQSQLNNEKDIRFLGFQSSPRDYLQIADLFLLTSREDPFPLVVLEAANCGLPVVCFDGAGGASEFVKSEAGIVVPFCDVDKMVDASIKILTDNALRVALGRKGQDQVNRSHTIDAVAPQILAVCRKVAKQSPKVSVIVPNYNHAKYLPERLDSIFNQTFRDFEVIILDDASTDDSREVIGNYSDRADVRVIQNETNSGSPFHQWITGLELANGEFIWIAESDDKCEDNFLQSLLPAFNDPDLRLAYANSWIIDSNGKVVGDYLTTDYLKDLSLTKWNSNYQISADREINDGLGIKNTILNISSAIFRKPHFEKSFYDSLELMRFAGDWFFIVNLIRNGYVHYESQKLNFHRRHDESVIGELIKNKKVEGFYKEIASVQRSICELYDFDPKFADKWAAYHQKQWSEFFPNTAFENLNSIFPYQELIRKVRGKSRKEIN